jgi:hypothetical protein
VHVWSKLSHFNTDSGATGSSSSAHDSDPVCAACQGLWDDGGSAIRLVVLT